MEESILQIVNWEFAHQRSSCASYDAFLATVGSHPSSSTHRINYTIAHLLILVFLCANLGLRKFEHRIAQFLSEIKSHNFKMGNYLIFFRGKDYHGK